MRQQCAWLADLDEQEPMVVSAGDGGEFDFVEVYSRPGKPGAVPKLQGPFYVGEELEGGEVTDLHVVAAKIGDEALFDGDDEDDEAGEGDEEEGLSVGIVCVATNTSRVHICLDLDGIEAEWLPNKQKLSRSFSPDGNKNDDDDDEKEGLILFETIDLSTPSSDSSSSWPTFTPSPTSRYELLTTTPTGV